MCVFRIASNIAEEIGSELYVDELHMRLSQQCIEDGLLLPEREAVTSLVTSLFTAAEIVFKTAKQEECINNVKFTHNVVCNSLPDCIELSEDINVVSGSSDHWPITVEVTTDQFIENERLINRVDLYEDSFELFVHEKQLDLSGLQIDNGMSVNEHHAIFRIAKHLRLCPGVLPASNISESMNFIEYKDAGSGYHASTCSIVIPFNSQDRVCTSCGLISFEDKAQGLQCEDVVSYVQNAAIYVRGTPEDLPIQFCVIDVSSKMNGRYVTKEVSMFENEFSLTVDGNYIDIESSGFSNQKGFSQHREILEYVEALKLCQGVSQRLGSDWFSVLHEDGGDETVRAWHAPDCHVIRVIGGDSLLCSKCAHMSLKGGEARSPDKGLKFR